MEKQRVRKYFKKKLRKGDLIRTELSGVHGIHVCIILEDEGLDQQVKCLPVCNFTSNPPMDVDLSIDVSDYNLPDSYFNLKKSTSWLICKKNLCTYSVQKYDYLENLIVKHPILWNKICEASSNWTSDNMLESICDCEKMN